MSVPPPPPPPPPPAVSGSAGDTRPHTGGTSTKPASIREHFGCEGGGTGQRGPMSSLAGCVGLPGARVVRVVHISDTHRRHDEYAGLIPPGDVLIHSGDFTNHRDTRHQGQAGAASAKAIFRSEIQQMNDFFAAMPHEHKIFVAGNHETYLSKFARSEIASALSGVVYLQDSSVTVCGVRVYGSPWTNCRGMGFPIGHTDPDAIWGRIPADTDVLVTHLPPSGILDLAYSSRAKVDDCKVCGADKHRGYAHWGCPVLRRHVLNRIRPMAHLFGHVHDEHDIVQVEGVTFSNASMDMTPVPNIIDLYIDPAHESSPSQKNKTSKTKKMCNLA